MAPLLGAQYALDPTVLRHADGVAAARHADPVAARCVGAALTLGARGGGSLLALLVLPLYVPVLIFGAGAVDAVRAGLSRGAAPCRCSARACCWRSSRVRSPPPPRCDRARLTRDHDLNWFRFASPASFYPLAGSWSPWFGALAALLAGRGPRTSALVVAPTDAQQGDAYRIIFIHVPAAWMSMFIYLVMAGWSALALGFNTRLSAMMAQALAPTGALMTLHRAVDRRVLGPADVGHLLGVGRAHDLELILLFLYLGFIALRNAIEDPRRADRACAVLALVGAVNVPIIYFSVQWWNTLHQGSSISLTAAPKMAMTMLAGMLHHDARRVVLHDRGRAARVQAIIVERERGAGWLESLMRLAPRWHDDGAR